VIGAIQVGAGILIIALVNRGSFVELVVVSLGSCLLAAAIIVATTWRYGKIYDRAEPAIAIL
jgi:hypothetical protein